MKAWIEWKMKRIFVWLGWKTERKGFAGLTFTSLDSADRNCFWLGAELGNPENWGWRNTSLGFSWSILITRWFDPVGHCQAGKTVSQNWKPWLDGTVHGFFTEHDTLENFDPLRINADDRSTCGVSCLYDAGLDGPFGFNVFPQISIQTAFFDSTHRHQGSISVVDWRSWNPST